MNTIKIAARVAFVVGIFVLAAANIINWGFEMFIDITTLGFMLVGAVSLMLMSFSLPEIGAAFKHAFGSSDGVDEEKLKISAYFWESTARNLLVLGVLGTVIGYILIINFNTSIKDFGIGAAIAFLTTVYGLIPASLCAVPALVLKKKLNGNTLPTPPAVGQTRPLRWETITGYVLFFALIAWSVSGEFTTNFEVFLHWPSLLVVVGWALALLVLLGNAVAGHSVTLSFAFTGLIGIFIGIGKFLSAMFSGGIQDIAMGVTFSLLSCFFAMLGMLAAGMPMEDRAFKAGQNGKGTVLSRIAWYVFPMLVIAFILFSQLLAMIPIHKK
ncbi:MAG: hypothetical protein GY950_32145 [bacterium]|nr:hypothetical protein [bacterium]